MEKILGCNSQKQVAGCIYLDVLQYFGGLDLHVIDLYLQYTLI